MSAGTRSSAITAQAPACSAMSACSAVVTSMITPPLSISASPTFTRHTFPLFASMIVSWNEFLFPGPTPTGSGAVPHRIDGHEPPAAPRQQLPGRIADLALMIKLPIVTLALKRLHLNLFVYAHGAQVL